MPVTIPAKTFAGNLLTGEVIDASFTLPYRVIPGYSGSAEAVATATGTLLVTKALEGNVALAEATCTGDLALRKPLAGDALAFATASGDLTRGVWLEGASVAQATAGDGGGILVVKTLAGDAVVEASAGGVLGGQVFFTYVLVVPAENYRLYEKFESTSMVVPALSE